MCLMNLLDKVHLNPKGDNGTAQMRQRQDVEVVGMK